MRFIDAWTDEYRKFFLNTNPLAKNYSSDVSDRRKLRKDLKCKSFEWYLKNIDPENVMNEQMAHLGRVSDWHSIEIFLGNKYCLLFLDRKCRHERDVYGR